jgi:hypothetical protein
MVASFQDDDSLYMIVRSPLLKENPWTRLTIISSSITALEEKSSHIFEDHIGLTNQRPFSTLQKYVSSSSFSTNVKVWHIEILSPKISCSTLKATSSS